VSLALGILRYMEDLLHIIHGEFGGRGSCGRIRAKQTWEEVGVVVGLARWACDAPQCVNVHISLHKRVQ
jgi:hypothetical protein